MSKETHRYYRNSHFSVLKMVTKCCQSEFVLHQYTFHGKISLLAECKKCWTEWCFRALVPENHQNLSKSPNPNK